MSRVVFFELASTDTERARTFYSTVFDWRFQRWSDDDYWLATTGEDGDMGINGAVTGNPAKQPVVNTIGVADLDAQIAAVVAAGGRLVEGKVEVPEMGYLAYCADPDGNVFGMMQMFPRPG